jgi:hypothetical protein
MKAKVATLKSFYVDGKIKYSKYTSTVKDVEKLFDNAVSDAKLLAKNAKGSVTVQRTKTTLYINYLDVPKSELVDVTRMIVSEKLDSKLRQKIERFKTRHPLGFANDELEKLVSRIPELDLNEVYDTIGLVTVLLVKGKVIYYRRDVTNALYYLLERNRVLNEWIHYDEKHLINKHTGMIVIKKADLMQIKQTDVKGYEKLEGTK